MFLRLFETVLQRIRKFRFFHAILALPIVISSTLLVSQYSNLWVADMIVSFSPYIIIVCGITILSSFVLAKHRLEYVYVLVGLALLVCSLPTTYNWLFVNQNDFLESGDIRIASLNKYYANREYDELRKVVNPNEYDIVGLSETFDKDFKILKKQWRYSLSAECDCDPAPKAELVLLSNYPIIKNEVVSAGKESGGILRAVIKVKGKQLITYVAHTPSPISNSYFKKRNEMLQTIVPARIIQDKDKNAVFMGDLNISPYSSNYRKTERSLLGYTNIMRGSGAVRTWCLFKIEPICAPIDHIFVTNSISTTKPEIVRVKGSDHKLITTELVIN